MTYMRFAAAGIEISFAALQLSVIAPDIAQMLQEAVRGCSDIAQNLKL